MSIKNLKSSENDLKINNSGREERGWGPLALSSHVRGWDPPMLRITSKESGGSGLARVGVPHTVGDPSPKPYRRSSS